jgi:3-hydroxymyristoyl/3-hydroxydecanoyl-(acyl carrier protein) dehydratase
VFAFENITLSSDGECLSASCRISADQAFFAGHFPGAPIMPAVVQLQMIEALLQTRRDWPSTLAGGRAIKFLRPVVPGSELQIQLARGTSGTLRFSLEQDGCAVAKGTVQAAGNGIG